MLLTFVVTTLVMIMIPGPDAALIMRSSLAHGRMAGLLTMLGGLLGLSVHAAAAAIGLSALLVASPAAFTVVRALGVCYLLWLGADGESAFATHGVPHALLFATTGIVTAVPLICFGGAAIRVPMVTLGLLQYLTPTLQFLLGILYFHEDMPVVRWIGFVLVWAALAIFTADSLRQRRRTLRPDAEVAAVRAPG